MITKSTFYYSVLHSIIFFINLPNVVLNSIFYYSVLNRFHVFNHQIILLFLCLMSTLSLLISKLIFYYSDLCSPDVFQLQNKSFITLPYVVLKSFDCQFNLLLFCLKQSFMSSDHQIILLLLRLMSSRYLLIASSIFYYSALHNAR